MTIFAMVGLFSICLAAAGLVVLGIQLYWKGKDRREEQDEMLRTIAEDLPRTHKVLEKLAEVHVNTDYLIRQMHDKDMRESTHE